MISRQSIRAYQDANENHGWRISMIHDENATRIRVISPKNLPGYLSLLSFLAFVVVFATLFIRGRAGDNVDNLFLPAASLFTLSLVFHLLGRYLHKATWIRVEARCLDREIQKVAKSEGASFQARVLCEHEYLGKTVQCTPRVHWMGFSSELSTKKFLEERISADGRCMLRLNPKKPLEADLIR